MAEVRAGRRLPGLVPVMAGQVRYQLTLMLRTPRALIAGLVLPSALLALQLGKVQNLGGQAASQAVLAARVSGLVVLGAMSIAYLTYAAGLVSAREDGVLRRWRTTPLPSWGYFAGRIVAAVLVADVAALILVLVGVAMAGLHQRLCVIDLPLQILALRVRVVRHQDVQQFQVQPFEHLLKCGIGLENVNVDINGMDRCEGS